MIGLLLDKARQVWFALVHRRAFRSMGRNARIVSPFRVDGAANIELGANAFLQRGAWLYCVGVDDTRPSLRIGRGCVFGYNNHVTAIADMEIGDEVLTANNVYISDNVHGYENIATPIMHQPVRFKGRVRIGGGTWIGENACIIGASVGRNCVVSANAVVTHDVPDYCVVAGIPARIIRRFDVGSGRWISDR
jgi:acetyltransferase-like isoleucine patch superfamily enzyme